MSFYVSQGLKPWVIQRVSAVYIVLFILYALVSLYSSETIAYATWINWLYTPFNTVVVGIFLIALLLHAWIGMRDVVLDYINNSVKRILILSILISVLLGCGLWVFKILLLSVAS